MGDEDAASNAHNDGYRLMPWRSGDGWIDLSRDPADVRHTPSRNRLA
jgi:hypothetical protein